MFTMLINILEDSQPAMKHSAPFTAQSVAWRPRGLCFPEDFTDLKAHNPRARAMRLSPRNPLSNYFEGAQPARTRHAPFTAQSVVQLLKT